MYTCTTNIHVYINTNVHTTSYACVCTALHTYMCAHAYSIVNIQKTNKHTHVYIGFHVHKTHTSIFIRMYTAPTYEPPCINAYIHHRIYTHACVSRYIYKYIYIPLYIYRYMYIRACLRVCACKHIYIYMHTHIHTHTHACVIFMCMCM